MKLLVLGGTRFLGPALVESALARGDEITLFNRGESAPDAFPNVEQRRGDRSGSLDALRDGSWDAVIDTCGFFPRHVLRSAELLADRVERYLFVSSVSVYGDFLRGGDESTPVVLPDDFEAEELNAQTFGPLKALCEQAAERAMPGRSIALRPGLLVGPRDDTDRFTYWPRRLARGGEVLAPGDPDASIQLLDVRDLADFCLELCARRASGPMHAFGPVEPLTMRTALEGTRVALDADARLTWVPDAFLEARDVQPWTGLPLWIPGAASERAPWSLERALAHGLRFRPFEETVRDTLAWADTLPTDRAWEAGIDAEREAELLAAFHAGSNA